MLLAENWIQFELHICSNIFRTSIYNNWHVYIVHKFYCIVLLSIKPKLILLLRSYQLSIKYFCVICSSRLLNCWLKSCDLKWLGVPGYIKNQWKYFLCLSALLKSFDRGCSKKPTTWLLPVFHLNEDMGDFVRINTHGKRRNPFEDENNIIESRSRCKVEEDVIVCECTASESDTLVSLNHVEKKPVSAYLKFRFLKSIPFHWISSSVRINYAS